MPQHFLLSAKARTLSVRRVFRNERRTGIQGVQEGPLGRWQRSCLPFVRRDPRALLHCQSQTMALQGVQPHLLGDQRGRSSPSISCRSPGVREVVALSELMIG